MKRLKEPCFSADARALVRQCRTSSEAENEDGLVDQGCRSRECDRTEGVEVRGIRVAIDVVVGWVEEVMVMGMVVVNEGTGSAAKRQGYRSPDSVLQEVTRPALDSLRAASLFTHNQESQSFPTILAESTVSPTQQRYNGARTGPLQ